MAAILTVPASLVILQPFLPVESDADAGRIAAVILQTFLLPLAAGMLFRVFAPYMVDKFGDPLMRVAGILLALGAVIVIIASWGCDSK